MGNRGSYPLYALSALKAITNDFKRALQSRWDKATEKEYNLAMNKAMQQLKDQLTIYEAELDELTVAIKKLETSTAPEKYVRNKAINERHRVLTTFNAESEGISSRDIVRRLVEELNKETLGG